MSQGISMLLQEHVMKKEDFYQVIIVFFNWKFLEKTNNLIKKKS